MLPLDPSYRAQVDELMELVQEADELAAWQENEEEGDYAALREGYESGIAELYREVAEKDPLQLPALEESLLDDRFEGLFLPRLLGFTVLRGPVNEHIQFHYPQEPFRKVLLTICASSNFDEIRKRIGQTVQIGFALSSHIWVTNLLEEVENRQIRQWLQSQVLEKYHDPEQRRLAYQRYALQFRDEVYFTADLPVDLPELRRTFPAIRMFLERRVKLGLDNTSFLAPLTRLVMQKELVGSYEHRYLTVLFIHFFDPPAKEAKQIGQLLNTLRKEEADFADAYFRILAELHHGDYRIDAACDKRVGALVDMKVEDDLSAYYTLTGTIHGKGYIHKDAIDEVGRFYSRHKGVSVVNECVRLTVYQYLRQFLQNISEEDYTEWFDISKTYSAYFLIFDNEHFKQDIEALNSAYLQRLLKTYTDKRGKDYQDIKRFVQTVFVDLGFFTDKEVVEVFKTRRKKKAEQA